MTTDLIALMWIFFSSIQDQKCIIIHHPRSAATNDLTGALVGLKVCIKASSLHWLFYHDDSNITSCSCPSETYDVNRDTYNP